MQRRLFVNNTGIDGTPVCKHLMQWLKRQFYKDLLPDQSPTILSGSLVRYSYTRISVKKDQVIALPSLIWNGRTFKPSFHVAVLKLKVGMVSARRLLRLARTL